MRSRAAYRAALGCKPRFEVPVDQSLIDKAAMNGGKGDPSEDVVTRRMVYMIVNVIQTMNAAFSNYREQVCHK